MTAGIIAQGSAGLPQGPGFVAYQPYSSHNYYGVCRLEPRFRMDATITAVNGDQTGATIDFHRTDHGLHAGDVLFVHWESVSGGWTYRCNRYRQIVVTVSGTTITTKTPDLIDDPPADDGHNPGIYDKYPTSLPSGGQSCWVWYTWTFIRLVLFGDAPEPPIGARVELVMDSDMYWDFPSRGWAWVTRDQWWQL